MEEKKWCVYMHTNKKNGKVYIGITSNTPKRRWDNGCGYTSSYFHNAIDKYGWDGFTHEVLFDKLSQKDAEQKEIDLIREYKSNNRLYGYNISAGGMVMCGENSPNFGKKQSSETIEKRMKNMRGENNYQAREIIEIRTLERFKCLTYAENKYHIDLENIIACCKNKRNHAGTGEDGYYLIWMYYDDYTKSSSDTVRNKIRNGLNKKVKCEETGKIYINASRAGKEYNIPHGNITQCCKGKRKTAKNLHWTFINKD